MSLFYGLHQNGGIRRARRAADTAQSAAVSAHDHVRDLQQQLDMCLMLVEALWELSREANGWTDEQLVERVTEIDMRDGRADGRVRRMARPCVQCGRAIAPERRQCMWCGTVDPRPFGEPKRPTGDTTGPGGLAP